MRSYPSWLKTCIISSGSASIVISTTAGTVTEIMQFGISVFLKAQEINLRGTVKVNMMNIAYFYVNLFRCTKKFLSLLTLQAFFETLLPPLWFQPMFISWYFDYVNNINCSFNRKACKYSIKRLKHKKCSKSYQNHNTPSTKRLRQTCFFRF